MKQINLASKDNFNNNEFKNEVEIKSSNTVIKANADCEIIKTFLRQHLSPKSIQLPVILRPIGKNALMKVYGELDTGAEESFISESLVRENKLWYVKSSEKQAHSITEEF